MKRLAIITTHPIQYNAPLFALLTKRAAIRVKVFYTWGEDVLQKKFDPGFNKNIEWDIPLLEGYEYSFVQNIAKDKGSHHFRGIDNPTLNKEIKDWGADAILVYGWSFKSHLKALRYFHGKLQVLFRGDSISLSSLPFLKKIVRNIFLKWVYRHIDYAFFVGTHNKKYFKSLGLHKNQLIFAPHAVDNERFIKVGKDGEVQIANWKKDLGIVENQIILLYAGKLDYNKNVGLLASAFKEINKRDTHLVIAGSGITESMLKKEFSAQPNIHFLPFQNQSIMPAVYGLADVFVLPSLSETWGLAINEAMACGKAILAGDACGAAIDLVKESKNGFIFKSNDPQDLAKKMKMLVNDKNKLKDMGEASGNFIRDWSFEKTAKAIEAIMMQNK